MIATAVGWCDRRRRVRALAGAARSVRHRQPQPARQFQAAVLLADGGSWASPLGTDDQGRDMLSAHHVRHADQPAGRRQRGAVRGRGRASPSGCSPAMRAASSDAAADAGGRRATDLSRHPDGAAGRWRDRRACCRDPSMTGCRSTSSCSPSASAAGRSSPAPCAAPPWSSAARIMSMAARVIGVSSARIMVSHILPNVLGPVLVIGTLDARAWRSWTRRRCPSSASACRRRSPRWAR